MIGGEYFNEVDGIPKKSIIIFCPDDSVSFFVYNAWVLDDYPVISLFLYNSYM